MLLNAIQDLNCGKWRVRETLRAHTTDALFILRAYLLREIVSQTKV